eukprot:gene23935-biopygen18437
MAIIAVPFEIKFAAMLWLAPIVLLLATSSTCSAGMVGRKLLQENGAPPAYSSDNVEPSTVDLVTAEGFTVLAATTVTNTGPTTVGGWLGVNNGEDVPGENEITYSGSGRANQTVAAGAMGHVVDAYNDAAGRDEGVVVINAVNIGGVTFTPGLYKTTGALEVSSGTLYLSGKGVYIFQMETTLSMSTGRQMVLADGAEASDIFWVVGSSATFEANSVAMGTFMAHQAISVKTGASITGRLFAINAAVTMQSNTVAFPAADASSSRRRQLLDIYSTDAVSPEAVDLLFAERFTVLAYATITNSGATKIGGLIGVSPGSAITGQTEITYYNRPELNDRASTEDASTAKADVTAAYKDVKDREVNVVNLDRVNIGGLTFTPGLYKTTGSLEVSSGELTLSGDGVYIFQIEETFSVSSNLKMILKDGARASNIFWQIGSAANFAVGTFMAYAKIDVWSGAKITGRLFSLNEAVNMLSNDVVFPFHTYPTTE